ncbi:hypothetical protein ARMGADRAFT_769283 [Armillaria gallica]|uniref:Uncharacterized protein n=1 Tax=Armillaria gallica TaxID=47427 RepID=A0A2H3CFZ9_ARMGA|nr:hypothetical protein ARMGADRAFT_769283 [Armillaria gallica]
MSTSISHLSFSTASTTPVASGSGSNSFSTVAIVAGVVGGVSTCAVIGLVVYLLVQRRRQRKGLRQPGYFDTEKGPAITKNIPALPAAYHSKGEMSPWFTESLQPARPAIKVITDLSIGKALPKSPNRPTTPKWKLKRVPVPRLSRLPPSPLLSRARSRLSFSRSSSRRTTKIDVPPVPILPSPSLPPTPVPTVLVLVPSDASSPTIPFSSSTPSVATPLHSLPPTTLVIPTSDPDVPSSAVSPLYTLSPAFPSPSVFLSSVGTLPSVNQRPTVI